MGYKFKYEAVLSSELRVLTELNFEINLTTPYDFMELLLEILDREVRELPTKDFYRIGVNMLFKYYSCREEIYKQLYETMTGRTKDLSGRYGGFFF
jgi:hypothetical protein